MSDEIIKDLKLIRESQIRMEGDLKYHIRRTDLLEGKVELEVEAIHAKIKPIHKAHTIFVGIIKVVLTASAVYLALSRLGLIKS